MSTGLEQYGQCSGHWYESSATSVYGLGAGIDHQSLLRHAAEQLAHVVGYVGAAVALRQRGGDVADRALAVAKLEHLRRRRVQADGALGDEQHVLLAHVVVLQPGAVHEPGPVHAGACGCVSPRSIASSWAQSTSVLKRSAATARSCCSRVPQRSTTRRSASSASRGASRSRSRKYCSPAGSIQG